jgi:ubiquinone/menaquinone biosynthesis C-methylase UbiE
MPLRERLIRAYFNSVYNPLYDESTAHVSRYAEAQEKRADSLHVEPGLRILCAGLGTGNELTVLRALGAPVNIVGIDLSRSALERAQSKPAGRAAGTALLLMDAQRTAFCDGAFDRVLCYHVLDFVGDAIQTVEELLRILKPGGRFVISFPAGSEGPGLGSALLSHSLKPCARWPGSRIGRVARAMLAGCIYLPLTLRRGPRVFTQEDVQAVLCSRGAVETVTETDLIYRDHIASGIKEKKGGQSRAT